MKIKLYILALFCGFCFALSAQNTSNTVAYPIDDIEPNNTWRQALPFTLGTSAEGTINYTGHDGKADKDDWYKLTLTTDGTLSFAIALFPDTIGVGYSTDGTLRLAIHLQNYLAEGDTINLQTNYKSVDYYTFGEVLNVSFADIPKGEYYIKLTVEHGFGGYRCTPAFEPWEGNDPEPNDTQAQAVQIEFGQKVTGFVGAKLPYYNAEVLDGFDYYRIELPLNGALHLYCTERKLSAAQYQLKMNLYSAEEPTDALSFREISEDETSDSENKTLTFHQYRNNLTAGTYFIEVKDWYGPGAYEFRAEFEPAPVAGFLLAQNNADVTFTNTTKNATEYKWNFGDGYSSTLVNPTHSYTNYRGEVLQGVYNVELIATNENGTDTISHEVNIRGLQRIESTSGGQGEVSINFYAGGLKQDYQKQLTSKALLRLGATELEPISIVQTSAGCAQATFDLSEAALGKYDAIIRNEGEDDMVLAEAFTLEPSSEPNVYTDLQTRQKVLRGRWQTITAIIGNKGNTDAMYQSMWIVTPHGHKDSVEVKFLNVDFGAKIDETRENADSLLSLPDYIVLDTINGEVRKVRLYGLMFKRIPAMSEINVNFKVRSFDDYQVQILETKSLFTSEMIIAESTPENAAESGQKASAAERSCIAGAIAKYGIGKAASLIPGVGCAMSVVSEGADLMEKGYGEKSISAMSWVKSFASVAWSCASDLIPAGTAYKAAALLVDFAIDAKGNYDAAQDCKNKPSNDGFTKSVASMDPNEMIGPSGLGKGNYIAPKPMNYTILFENKATATAAAQEVIITDTIDNQRFDVKSLKFSNFGFNDTILTPVQDGTDFAYDFALNSSNILRISGHVDTVKNIVSWRFITLDKTTMDLTEDPDAGFLPPNVIAPEGEGFVSFSIDLLPNLPDRTEIENKATIVFDLNEPIHTNIYKNTIDLSAPESRVIAVEPTKVANMYNVIFSGSDLGSGIMSYELYAIRSNGDHELLGTTNRDTLTLALEEGTYELYAIATDHLYYREADKTEADNTFLASGAGIKKPKANKNLTIYPNPASEYVDVVVTNSEDNVLSVYSFDGQLIKQQAVQNTQTRVSLAGFANGIYMIRCGTSSQRLIVQ